ncbi:38020_t:CDS:2 [Gigaspora margarita]|uniref:cellulase n=1 Tax=Gigaspora margarita TaxID=4874 RepID=A0ABN7VTS0_GIGMA|nr:38020_t:CDS:2 [Gigaspora margarita]
MDPFHFMLKKQYSLLFLTLVMICITRIVFASEVKTSLGLIPSPDIPGIPKEGNDYSKLLAYSLYFYEAQRSGILPSDNRVTWRHNSALDDGKDKSVDLTGVSDYVKFTLTLSWTLSIVSWGAIEWFEGYQLSNQTQYLYDMIKWGTDWLIKAHPKPDQLFIQVGSSTLDNKFWGPDTNIPYPRPSTDVNSTAHGTDVAAETAAAFASSAILFRDFYNDTAYANKLLSHATSIYTFAESLNLTLSSTVLSNGIYGYSTSEYYDKLIYGAIWLYRATYQSQYLDKAIKYYNIYNNMSYSLREMSWDDQIGACYILLSQIYSGKSNPNSTFWRNVTENYLDYLISNNTGSSCNFTSGGLFWCSDDSKQDSIPVSLYSAFGYLMYSSYATTTEKANKYRNFVTSQINYLFGANPMKMFYVVAVHPNSPKNPHHAGAHGGTNVENLFDPPETKYPLYGAIVGGPSMNDSYLDLRNDIIQSEVALDYNAAFQGIMAYYVIDTYVPTSPSSPNEPINPINPVRIVVSTFQKQKIIIIAVSCSVFFLLLILSAVLYKYKRSKDDQKKPSDIEERKLKKLKDLEEIIPKEPGNLEENNMKELTALDDNLEKNPAELSNLEENKEKGPKDLEENNLKESNNLEENNPKESNDLEENDLKEPSELEENNQKIPNDFEENNLKESNEHGKNNLKEPTDLEENNLKESNSLEKNNLKEPSDLEENNQKIPSDLKENNQKIPSDINESNQKDSSSLEENNQKEQNDLAENNQKIPRNLEENNLKESNGLGESNQKDPGDLGESNQTILNVLEENNQKQSNGIEENNQKKQSDIENNNKEKRSDLEENNK